MWRRMRQIRRGFGALWSLVTITLKHDVEPLDEQLLPSSAGSASPGRDEANLTNVPARCVNKRQAVDSEVESICLDVCS